MRAQMLAMALRGRAGGGPLVSIFTDGSISDAQIAPDEAFTAITFNPNGTIDVVAGPYGSSGTWATGAFNAADYALYVTPTAGSFSSGTVTTLLALTSSRSFTVTRSSNGLKSCTATFEIRPSGGGAAISSQSISMSASVSL